MVISWFSNCTSWTGLIRSILIGTSPSYKTPLGVNTNRSISGSSKLDLIIYRTKKIFYSQSSNSDVGSCNIFIMPFLNRCDIIVHSFILFIVSIHLFLISRNPSNSIYGIYVPVFYLHHSKWV